MTNLKDMTKDEFAESLLNEYQMIDQEPWFMLANAVFINTQKEVIVKMLSLLGVDLEDPKYKIIYATDVIAAVDANELIGRRLYYEEEISIIKEVLSFNEEGIAIRCTRSDGMEGVLTFRKMKANPNRWSDAPAAGGEFVQ